VAFALLGKRDLIIFVNVIYEYFILENFSSCQNFIFDSLLQGFLVVVFYQAMGLIRNKSLI